METGKARSLDSMKHEGTAAPMLPLRKYWYYVSYFGIHLNSCLRNMKIGETAFYGIW